MLNNPNDSANPNPNPSISTSAAYDRFIQSMVIDFDKWHDGEGYDLKALDELTPAERESVANMLRTRHDWRDVEALAYLNPPDRETLRRTFDDEHAQMITRLKAGEELERLGEKVDFAPLTLLMLDVADGNVSIMSRIFDFLEWRKGLPPADDWRIKKKVLQLLQTNRNPSSANWAAIAFVLFGLCKSQWDFEHRSFWLRFQERDDHDAAFAELLDRIGVKGEELQ